MHRLSLALGLPVGLVVLVIAVVVSIGTGPISVPPETVLGVLRHEVLHSGPEFPRLETSVVMNLRMPRVLFGVLTGAALAVSGAALQSLFRNPLTDPGIIGVSSGASAGAAGAIVVLSPFSVGVTAWVVPICAFAGGILATTLIYALARPATHPGTARLLLVGIAMGSAFSALTGFFTFIADDDELHSVVFWQMGSLGSIDMLRLGVATPMVLLGLVVMFMTAPSLDLMTLGERQAHHLGVNVNRTRIVIVTTTALLTGTCVAFAGSIGFIGLVVPHIARLLCGPGHRALVPLSAVLGAILIVVADTLSRTIAPPSEIPLGLFTAAMGAPFFLLLILRSPEVRV